MMFTNLAHELGHHLESNGLGPGDQSASFPQPFPPRWGNPRRRAFDDMGAMIEIWDVGSDIWL